MVNEKGKRELAYFAEVTAVKPIEGYDRVEQAFVNGWSVLVRKGQFKVGDVGIFFEVDSKLPQVEPFLFLEKRHYKIKTIRMCKILSQGLLMSFEDFNGTQFKAVIDKIRMKEGKWLTDALGVTYSMPEDNERKGNVSDQFKSTVDRHPHIAKATQILHKYKWFRNLFVKLFYKKKGKSFPNHFPFVKPTDEERIENLMPQIDEIRKRRWVATQKLDGTSSTYILERKGKKYEFYVCSRNVRQLNPNQSNYHTNEVGDNVYWQMAKKYNIENVLKRYLKENPKETYVALQGETVGPKLQGNPLHLEEVDFYGFNFITSLDGRWGTLEAKKEMEKYGIKWVPVIDTNYEIPATIEEIKEAAEGETLGVGTGLREGVVYRSMDGVLSFKNVANSYLLSKGGK